MREPVYDDGSTVEIECASDEPPRSGVWAETSTADATAEEKAEGERQGREIDIDDDEDNGGIER